ncbi:TolC family protein [Chryseotalea sanaruensis]|uniref:TolC family protein n=2 Tax=Chryseotalea sanaruensis TaxID=2482724 RepID=A0A401U647_9BACT|nr:TolC family protein [Chryseotalea sanaruensis]
MKVKYVSMKLFKRIGFKHQASGFRPLRITFILAACSLKPAAQTVRSLVLLLLITLGVATSEEAIAQEKLTLGDAIKIAQQSSRNIRKSQLNLYGSQRSLDAQRLSLKSKFALDVTPFDYNRNRNFNDLFSTWNTNEDYNSFANLSVSQPIFATDGRISLINRLGYRDNYSEFQDIRTKTFSNNLYLQLDQPIFTYNRTKIQLKELELNLENATISNALELLTLEQNVTRLFYTFYQRQNSLQISKDEYENQKISYEITKKKVDADLLAQEELYQAELNLATSRSTLENNEVLLANAADDFKLLLGMDLTQEIEVDIDINFVTRKVDLNQALAYALENRMELRQRAIDIERSQFELIRTKALNEFKGAVALSLGVFGDNERAPDIYNVPSVNPRIAISFSIPIFDWGENRARMDAANTSREIKVIDLEIEKNDIMINIRKVYRNLQNLENQISIAEQNVKNATLTYDLNLERYKNGDLTSIDLNRFQSQLSEKKGTLADALINYKMELLNLKILSLYNFETQEPVIAPQK